MTRVLVTGGSGFVGSHCIVRLLDEGYEVRTTIRDPSREAKVRAMVRRARADDGGERLSFCTADLLRDEGWAEAVAGCDFVLHVASPFPSNIPKDPNDLIAPARDGTLRVLRAARDAGVRRVVLTSSFAAIGYGHEQRAAPFTEADWTNLDERAVPAYHRSKTMAERAAWDFLAHEGGDLELATVNPVVIFGPVLGPDYATSILLVRRLLDGSIPGCPDLRLQGVDVRDVAELHVKAMIEPAAAGQRYLATAGEMVSIRDIALMLREELGAAAAKVPTRRLPSWLMRVVGLFDRQVRVIASELGKPKQASNAKARAEFGWDPITTRDSVIATAQSLFELGLVKK